MNNPKTNIKEVNEFFYIDFKKYVYKNRKQINQKLKGLPYRKKVEFLELLWKKIVGKGFGKDADGRDIHYKLKSDKVIKEVDFTEDSPTKAHPQGGRILTNKTTVMDMLDVISHKEFGPDYHKLNNSQKKKVHKIALKHKILESYLEERSKGKLRPADKLRRKAAMAGKRAAIARRRKRTMTRRKPLAKLKKIAYKKAYLQVYDEFMKDLFPGMKKKDLSIQQAKIVHKNVLRKKKRVLKRAKFRFLPALRDKEVQKFKKD